MLIVYLACHEFKLGSWTLMQLGMVWKQRADPPEEIYQGILALIPVIPRHLCLQPLNPSPSIILPILPSLATALHFYATPTTSASDKHDIFTFNIFCSYCCCRQDSSFVCLKAKHPNGAAIAESVANYTVIHDWHHDRSGPESSVPVQNQQCWLPYL